MMYYVNNETKEHRKAPDGISSPGNTWSTVFADADGWIPWEGGECPLPAGHLVDVRARNGEENHSIPAGKGAAGWPDASACFWENEEAEGDIIAYRPILDADPSIDVTRIATEPPAWDGEGLPPVGARVKWGTSSGVVVSIYRNWLWVEHDSGVMCTPHIDIAGPIRSEEGRAVDAIYQASGVRARDGGRQVAADIYAAIRAGEIPGIILESGS